MRKSLAFLSIVIMASVLIYFMELFGVSAKSEENMISIDTQNYMTIYDVDFYENEDEQIKLVTKASKEVIGCFKDVDIFIVENRGYITDFYDVSEYNILIKFIVSEMPNDTFFYDIVLYDKIANMVKNYLFISNFSAFAFNYEILTRDDDKFGDILSCLDRYDVIIELQKKINKEINTRTDESLFLEAEYNNNANINNLTGFQFNLTNWIQTHYPVMDDLIINYISRDYFFSEGEHCEYGDNYGYYISTSVLNSYSYISRVMVFRIEKYYPKGVGSFCNLFEFRFIPEFYYNYLGIIKTNFSSQLYNFGNMTSFVDSYDDTVLKMSFSDICSSIYIESISNYANRNNLVLDYSYCNISNPQTEIPTPRQSFVRTMIDINTLANFFVSLIPIPETQFLGCLLDGYGDILSLIDDSIPISYNDQSPYSEGVGYLRDLNYYNVTCDTLRILENIPDYSSFYFGTNNSTKSYYTPTEGQVYSNTISFTCNTSDKEYFVSRYAFKTIGDVNGLINDMRMKYLCTMNVSRMVGEVPFQLKPLSFYIQHDVEYGKCNVINNSMNGTFDISQSGFYSINIYSQFANIYQNNLYGLFDIKRDGLSVLTDLIYLSMGGEYKSIVYLSAGTYDICCQYFLTYDLISVIIRDEDFITLGSSYSFVFNKKSAVLFKIDCLTEGWNTIDCYGPDTILGIYDSTGNLIDYSDDQVLLDEEWNEYVEYNPHLMTYLTIGSYYIILTNKEWTSGVANIVHSHS